jgi:hypothetical protein
MLIALLFPSFTVADEAPEKTSSITIVKGKSLAFDPKTCRSGVGPRLDWGLGSVVVTVLGHEKDHCVFDYRWEVENPLGHVVHRVRVPIDSRPVVIEADMNKGTAEHRWSVIYTSFTNQQAKLVRRVHRGWQEDLVDETDQFVIHQFANFGDVDKPLKHGDKVTFRFVIYLEFADGNFRNVAGDKWRTQTVTLTLGKDAGWKWIQAVAEGMQLYEIQRVRVPARIAGDAKNWLPGYKDDSQILAEMQAIAAEKGEDF